METQNELTTEIGTEEATTLKPGKVKIELVEIQEVGEKKSKKIVCACKHPDKAENISISAVKYENKGKLEVSGLWVNKDNAGMIRKGSALAVFMLKTSSKTPVELTSKEAETTLDEKGYLCFKGY